MVIFISQHLLYFKNKNKIKNNLQIKKFQILIIILEFKILMDENIYMIFHF